MQRFRGEYDKSAAKQKTQFPRKRVSPHPLLRIALDVFGHVPLVVQYAKGTWIRHGKQYSKGFPTSRYVPNNPGRDNEMSE